MHTLLILLLFLLNCPQNINQIVSEELSAVVDTRWDIPAVESLPQTASVLDVCMGDLGNDGTQDIAVVIQTLIPTVSEPSDYEYESFSRSLFIFTETSTNSFVCTHQNNDIILSSDSGGMLGDPYNGIIITDGKLIVSDYGGSSDRWGNDYVFEQIGQELILTEIEYFSESTHSGNGTRETYDLMAGTVREEAISIWNEDFKPLLLYSGTFEPQTIRFEEARAFQQETLSPSPSYPMPSLSYYYYFEDKELNYSTEEVLDLIQAEYYPEMERIEIPCDAQILENYSLLLGYQVPRYYYSDGNSMLYYFDPEYHRYYEKYYHTVIYISNLNEMRFYNIDDTGEEPIRIY